MPSALGPHAGRRELEAAFVYASPSSGRSFVARGDGEAVVAWDVSTKARRTPVTPPRACSRSARNSTWDATTAQSASGTRRAAAAAGGGLEHGHDGSSRARVDGRLRRRVRRRDGAVVVGRPRGRGGGRRGRARAPSTAPTRSRRPPGCLYGRADGAARPVWSARNRADWSRRSRSPSMLSRSSSQSAWTWRRRGVS